MVFKLSLRGLTVRDQRLIQVVLARVSNPKYRFEVSTRSADRDIQIMVTDPALAQVDEAMRELRALNPAAVEVCLSDPCVSAKNAYRLDRRMLMIQIRPMLHRVIESEALMDLPVRAVGSVECERKA